MKGSGYLLGSIWSFLFFLKHETQCNKGFLPREKRYTLSLFAFKVTEHGCHVVLVRPQSYGVDPASLGRSDCVRNVAIDSVAICYVFTMFDRFCSYWLRFRNVPIYSVAICLVFAMFR